MDEQLFERTDTSLHKKERLIANNAGMELFCDLNNMKNLALQSEASIKELQESVKELRESVKSLQESNEDLRESNDILLSAHKRLRITTLDEWSQVNPSSAERDERNAVAHGGDVKTDITVIRDMERIRPDRAARWKRVFKANYEMSFDKCVGKNCLKDADGRVIEMLNMLANVRVLNKWNQDEMAERRGHIIRNSVDIVTEWFNNPADSFGPHSRTWSLYEEAKDLYYR